MEFAGLDWLCETCKPVYDDNGENASHASGEKEVKIIHRFRAETLDGKYHTKRLTMMDIQRAETNGFDVDSIRRCSKQEECTSCKSVFISASTEDKHICQECGDTFCGNCTEKTIISSCTRKPRETCDPCTRAIFSLHNKSYSRYQQDGRVRVEYVDFDSLRVKREQKSFRHVKKKANRAGRANPSRSTTTMTALPAKMGHRTLRSSSQPTIDADLAATQFLNKARDQAQSEFVVLSLTSLQAIHLCILVRRKHVERITKLETSTVACGLAGVWGNKGGVGCSFTVDETNRFAFVAAHLAARADAKRDAQRNKDYFKICKNLKLSGNNGSAHGNPALDLFHNVDHLFFMGDLNYRVTYGHSGTEYEFEGVKLKAANRDFGDLVAHDQLRGHMENHRSFSGFVESTINFAPTYRMVKRKKGMRFDETFMQYGNKKFQSPSYCDRVLWRSHLGERLLQQKSYAAVQECTQSDHRPVVASFNVELKEPYVGELCGFCFLVV